jgi:hypothetical protein
MAKSFIGLEQVMRDSKLNPDTIPNGKFTIFINRRQNAFKILIGKHHLVYHNNGNRKFPLEAIQTFPEFFDGKKIDFAAAVKKAIQRKLALQGVTFA